ncbi:MAG TPA: hypothetical protein VFO48_03390, partial [Vicinamibacterales bacterium]|nr:hypothetical protein [Vicinamibacterales bacterium]
MAGFPQFPVSGTFKHGILDGIGNIELSGTAPNPAEPVPRGVSSLGLVAVSGESPSLSFGGKPFAAKTSFSAGADAGLEVMHAAGTSAAVRAYLPEFTVPADSIAMRFFANAKGSVAAGASVPSIPGLTFGASADGRVSYWRVVTMPASTAASAAIQKALSDVRLPGQRGSLDAVPAPGEVVAFEYGGTLELKADFTWGYALTGIESLQIGALEPSVAYDLRLKASAALGYLLAGEFVTIVRAGARPGWVRLTVRKKRDSKLAFATGFAVNAKAKVDFAEETVDDVLIAFFGADARRALRLFDEFRTFTDLDALEKRAGKVLFSSLQKLSHKWIGHALDQTHLGKFVGFLGEVVEAYKKFDQRVLDLYEDFLKRSKLTELRAALEKINQLKRREDLTTLTDADAWTVIRRLGEAELFSLVESNAAFQTAKDLSAQLLTFLDGSALKDLIDRLEEDLRLDEIFGRLEQISSKEALLALSDKKLQGVVERIVGGAFEDIRKSDAGKALEQLKKTLDGINTFRREMVAKLESALNKAVSMEINYAYTRTASDRALVDMEFDVSSAK